MLGGVCVGEAWPAGIVAGFDGGQPGSSDWEAGCCMKVAYESAHAGEITCTVSCGVLGGCCGCNLLIGNEREPPKLGTGWFTPPLEKNGAVVGEDGDGGFVKDNPAVIVTEFSDAHEVVLERRHDFG